MAIDPRRIADNLHVIRNPRFREFMRGALEKAAAGDYHDLKYASNLKWFPVGVEEFVCSTEYLNMRGTIYPAVLDELIEMNSGSYVEVLLTGGIGCVSCDTEYLSPQGWRRMDAYDGGLVGQWHDGRLEWVRPEYVVRPAKELYHFKTKYGVDQKVSPEHRVLYRQPKSGALEVRSAEEVYTRHQRTKKGFHGRLLTTFQAEGETVDPSLLRVQVMVCADGSFRNLETGLCYLNLKKWRKINRARSLLQAAGIEYTEYRENCAGYVRFGFHAPWKTKRLSDFGWGLGSASLQLIAEECVRWDGHKNNYFTTLKAEADFIQYAGSASGYRTTMDFDARALAPHWIVRFNPNAEITMQGVPKTPIKVVPTEDGKKYCFAVPSGFFVARRNGRVVITGNSAKTTAALITTAYQLYQLSCLKSPHALYQLDPSSEIELIFQSITETLAKAVNYARFKAMIEQSPYFLSHFPFNKRIESALMFPHRVVVKPVGGNATAAIGQNVMGGLIDELNYMSVVQNSKMSFDGGTYDQAVSVYRSLSRRRKSRFLQQGRMPGILCLVSSRNYPGEFTDHKEQEALSDPTIYVYDKRTWEIKPEGTFSGRRFWVYVGSESRKPRIVGHDEYDELDDLDQEACIAVPEEYRTEFDQDIYNSLRDIGGVATLSRFPFIVNSDAVGRAFGTRESALSDTMTDFDRYRIRILPKRIAANKHPRWAHIDLSISNDSTGLVVGHIPGFVQVERGDHSELLPEVNIDCSLEVAPPKGGEINFYKIRELLYKLRDLGMPIKWVSFDSFQSTDSVQLLRQKGFASSFISMDTSTTPYEVAKTALYDGRVYMPEHPKLQRELMSLERDPKSGKIDHPSTGSKDIADAFAGVVYGLTMRREIWARHNVLGRVPANLRAHQQGE